MKNILTILSKCKLFENLKTEEITYLLNCLDYNIKEYNKNDIVLLAGDKIDSIGIMLCGNIQITKNDIFGNSIILSKIGAGNIFAEAIVCSDMKKSPVSIIANTNNTNILYLPYHKIINTCSNSCKFHTILIYNMLKIIAQKNIDLNEKIEILSSKTIRDKLNIFFQKQIEKNNSRKFHIAFSRAELASYLNVNRSALSRELSNMQNDGILIFDKNHFEISEHFNC